MKRILKTTSCLLAVAAITFGFLSFKEDPPKDYSKIPVVGQSVAELTAPPFVPKPIGNRAATKLIVNMEITEQEGEIAEGVKYTYWTFGGTVPGSFIRTRVGDEVESHLKNHPDNKLPHNIDLHAVTGQGGGASSSLVAPGHEKTFSFKVINPGLYVYHCATAPVGMHIANGMYGLILVEPEGGLPPVDKEYYIMQGDFYTKGAYGEEGNQPFDMDKAVKEQPDYVVFNGKVGSLTGANAITAKVGETVRLFVGNGGPNLVSSFHVIGEIFDKVYLEGGDKINENVQTTLIPAGGSGIVEFKVDVNGTFILVDHSIFRAFNKGALGMLKAEGPENKTIYSGTIKEETYNPESRKVEKGKDEAVAPAPAKSTPVKTAPAKSTPVKTVPAKPSAQIFRTQTTPLKPAPQSQAQTAGNLQAKIAAGKNIFSKSCFACHQSEGQGIPNAFPPLAKSDYLNNNPKKAINAVIHGLSGNITVNGKKYNGVMTPQNLTDEEIANVLTYIFHSWGNSKKVITASMVKAERKNKPAQLADAH